ncbi:AraC family transcriptional regulator [Microbacterium sp. 1.5R]|uniref:AraC family transcriptional regulator n=1 Tax=Microbacterium sp. 1.5R TaxID=1916917 RepID=UPI0016426A20|nr:AraC family transcriptional regulator [Microbacterium sp. 1.5R]
MADVVRAWHPAVPGIREIYHATFQHAYPMHAHDGWAVMLVDRGAVSYGLHRESHIAAPRAMTLLPPGIPHDGRSAIPGQPYRKRVVYLDGDWLPTRARSLSVSRPTLTDQGVLTAIRRVHGALAAPGDLLAAEHWMLSVRRLVLAHLGEPTAGPADSPLARRLRAELDERFTETFALAEVAASFGVHPSHLIRVFSETYGLAPHQYVVSRRLDLARRLLLDGEAPASAAAHAGFHDQSHLTRHFRRVLGTTPAAFARSSR